MVVAFASFTEERWSIVPVRELKERATRAKVELRPPLVQEAEPLLFRGERWPLFPDLLETFKTELQHGA